MTYLNSFTIKRLLAAAIATTAVGLLAPSANASLVFKYSSSASAHYTGGSHPTDNDIAACLSYSSSQLGSVLCTVNSGGSQHDSSNNAFNFLLDWRGFSIKSNHQGGTSDTPTCVVVQDSNNNCYVWDVSKCWNETEGMDFSDICDKGSHITSITCYGETKTPTPTTSVPEPSTVIAGALVLLPFGVSTLRILRKSKMQPATN